MPVPTTSSMVERVKLALIGEHESTPGHAYPEYWDFMARAAIEAMRPDDSTMGLIKKLAEKTGMAPSKIDLAVCFYIDAALKE